MVQARELTFKCEFELAIMICKGTFPLFETDEMNFQILQCTAKSLKDNGKLTFTALNVLFTLFHSVKGFLASQKADGNATFDKNSFDLMTFGDYNITNVDDDPGNIKYLEYNERKGVVYFSVTNVNGLVRYGKVIVL